MSRREPGQLPGEIQRCDHCTLGIIGLAIAEGMKLQIAPTRQFNGKGDGSAPDLDRRALELHFLQGQGFTLAMRSGWLAPLF